MVKNFRRSWGDRLANDLENEDFIGMLILSSIFYCLTD
jgi:hypothetical protein